MIAESDEFASVSWGGPADFVIIFHARGKWGLEKANSGSFDVCRGHDTFDVRSSSPPCSVIGLWWECFLSIQDREVGFGVVCAISRLIGPLLVDIRHDLDQDCHEPGPAAEKAKCAVDGWRWMSI